jgi:hypothetical protein
MTAIWFLTQQVARIHLAMVNSNEATTASTLSAVRPFASTSASEAQ